MISAGTPQNRSSAPRPGSSRLGSTIYGPHRRKECSWLRNATTPSPQTWSCIVSRLLLSPSRAPRLPSSTLFRSGGGATPPFGHGGLLTIGLLKDDLCWNTAGPFVGPAPGQLEARINDPWTTSPQGVLLAAKRYDAVAANLVLHRFSTLTFAIARTSPALVDALPIWRRSDPSVRSRRPPDHRIAQG